MALMFRTPKDSTSPVELAGVGVLQPGGVGGLAVAEAARRGLAPLLVPDPATGYPQTNEDGSYVVLEGAQLAAAAKAWAAANGLDVHNARNDEELAAAAVANTGRPADEYPVPASAKAEAEAANEAARSGSVPLNADRDEVAQGHATPAPAAAAEGGDE